MIRSGLGHNAALRSSWMALSLRASIEDILFLNLNLGSIRISQPSWCVGDNRRGSCQRLLERVSAPGRDSDNSHRLWDQASSRILEPSKDCRRWFFSLL